MCHPSICTFSFRNFQCEHTTQTIHTKISFARVIHDIFIDGCNSHLSDGQSAADGQSAVYLSLSTGLSLVNLTWQRLDFN